MAKTKPATQKVFSWDVAAIVLRLLLAFVFIHHGGQKIFGWWTDGGGWGATIESWADPEGMGLPAPATMAAMITEFVGGICIGIGLLTRFWSAGLVILMAVAISYAHMHLRGDSLLDLELQLSLMATALALLLAGPGRYAVADFEAWVLGLKSDGG